MDAARDKTEKDIFRLNRFAAREYTRAAEDLRGPVTRYLKRHEKKRQRLLKMLIEKKITAVEFRKMREDDLIEDVLLLLDDETMSKATKGLWEQIVKTVPGIYAENYNYGLFMAENAGRMSYPLELMTEAIARELVKTGYIKLPGQAAKLAKKDHKAESLEKKWQKGLLRTAVMMTAGLTYPMQLLVEQIIEWVRKQNITAGRAYVTTAANTAENKARTDAFQKAATEDQRTQPGKEDPLVRGWVAIMDERTRVAHRKLDGTYVGMNEPWEIDGFKIWFPGDPSAPAYLIRNCRCTVDICRKSEAKGSLHRNETFNGQSYEEWKAAKPRRVK